MLELDDIQSGVLRPRPTPYVATYILLRIDDRRAGRELMRRLLPVVPSAAHPERPAAECWVSVSLTYSGLVALGVPGDSLDSFAWEFRQGMAARARALGDEEESSPEHWESPLGTPDVHVVLTALSPDRARLDAALERAGGALRELGGVQALWRQDCHALSTEREPFGFRDGLSHPAVEGSGIPGSNPHEVPLKAGEFVLGYPDETGNLPPMPHPDVLGRNGTYIVFRKLHQRVAAFRQYLKQGASRPEDEELLAAKMMGRWRSGAPLALCPHHDDASLGADPRRNNDFHYADDPTGYKTPPGSHARRANPRDASVAGVVRLHRMIRRGTAYGSELPEGVLEDDGADRGLMFAFIGSHLGRQFEFVQSEWINGGEFLGLGEAKDPLVGAHDGTGEFAYPRRPIPRCLKGLSRFVVTRGGEYGFMPGLRALRWLADLRT
ncbi:dyp-type peroxidase family protein [Corallococcus coralloides DSM 2259]|uniref:Dyp-type peroxidase family protein n=1 Tax=Corallococcus coralloides (strain ATCC 25202 / DSM 2259 / NBRC 100086 / M2) TaxID=1144275 RepID=H8MF72_CORCM|nr:peroxidase [Corallococcus coralloides]AFE05059.1 dyp-type peroxidase family protein [Corallococcus coralloides DSM 2259]